MIYIYKCSGCGERFKYRYQIPNACTCNCGEGKLILVETYANDEVYMGVRCLK